MADRLAYGVGAALAEVGAGVGAGSVNAGRVLRAVVVEVAAVFALPVTTDLTERTVGVSPAAGQTDPVSSALFGLLAELSGEAVSVVEADLDAGAVDTPFTERTFDVDVATRQTIISDANGACRTYVGLIGTFDRSSDAAVSGIRMSVSRDSAESCRTFADRIDSVRRFTNSVGPASVGKRARIVSDIL